MRQDINIIRTYAIIGIVMWHCFFCPYLCWGFFDSSLIPTTRYFSIFSGFFIPDALMPVFTFLSGYLFYYLYVEKGKYREWKDFVWKKTKRLVIPFFTIGTAITLTAPLRSVSQLIYGEGNHLWYAMMLFWCFLFAWTVFKINSKWITYFSALLSFAYMISAHGNTWYFGIQYGLKLPLGMHHAIFYYIYFYMGCMVFKYRKLLSERLLKSRGAILTAALYTFVFVVSKLGIKYVSVTFVLVKPFIFCILLWMLVNFSLRKGYIHSSKFVDNISKYGFGIYVFHEWIAWDVSHISLVTEYLEQHYLIFPFVYFFSIFVISYILTHLCLKTKVGRFLLAG